MKAARFHEYGGPEVLHVEDVPVPTPGPGQVQIRVAATSHNPIDGAIRSGAAAKLFPFPLPLPSTPGLDIAGIVSELGDGVEAFAVGDAVIGYLPVTAPGAAAEYVVAPVEVLAAAPTSVPLEDAAVIPLVGLTALQALFDHGALTSGERVLVVGGGSAVGGYAVQLAVNAGAEVVATAGPGSIDRVLTYGALQVFDRTGPSLDPTAIGSFDLVINTAPVPFPDLLAVTRRGGRIVSATTPVENDNDREVHAVRMGSRRDAAQLAHLVSEVDAGRLKIWVADRRPITDIAAVHTARAGKTVITPV